MEKETDEIIEAEFALVERPALEVQNFDAIRANAQALDLFYKNLMTENTDFGKIPGTPKPTLYKPGAEMLRLWADLAPTFEVDTTDTNRIKGVFFYEVTCKLYKVDKETGQMFLVGEGLGSCNNFEKKYRYRWVSKFEVPADVDIETLPQKTNGKYIDYRIENDQPHDLANTILKMAKKRAFIDAILTVTGASRIFTQDIEHDEDVPTNPKADVKQPEKKKPDAPAAGKLPTFIEDTNTFWSVARWITGKGAEDICSQLGIKKLEQLTTTFDEALDKLGALNDKKDWRPQYEQTGGKK